MITSITQDDELRRRLHRAVAVNAKPQWRDVRRRARSLEAPSRRRRRLLLATAAVAILVAAPAFAIATGAIDFSSSPAAPEPVKVLFNQLGRMSGPNFPAPVIGETRLVHTFHSADASYDLAVAPASGGGWCWAVVGREGTCDTRDGGLNYGYNPPPPVGNEQPLVDGSIAAAGVARVTIKFEDGSTLNLPFVQVSAPIDADFFLYEVPPDHWNEGTRPKTIAAYNADGVIVGAGWFIREADMPAIGTKG
jgi:hypothetical protein